MRIADRLARLEQYASTDPRMSSDEIDAATVRYVAELDADGTPCGRSVAAAAATWRRLVDAAVEPWLQRIYAGMSPADLYA
jgi:hypothetical protein